MLFIDSLDKSLEFGRYKHKPIAEIWQGGENFESTFIFYLEESLNFLFKNNKKKFEVIFPSFNDKGIKLSKLSGTEFKIFNKYLIFKSHSNFNINIVKKLLTLDFTFIYTNNTFCLFRNRDFPKTIAPNYVHYLTKKEMFISDNTQKLLNEFPDPSYIDFILKSIDNCCFSPSLIKNLCELKIKYFNNLEVNVINEDIIKINFKYLERNYSIADSTLEINNRKYQQMIGNVVT